VRAWQFTALTGAPFTRCRSASYNLSQSASLVGGAVLAPAMAVVGGNSRQPAFNASMRWESSSTPQVTWRSSMALLPLIVMSISDLLCLGLT
jgi:hypothetical protein